MAKRYLTKTAAVITINDMADLSDEGAKRLADWMREKAKLLTNKKERKLWAKTARFRYYYKGSV